MGAYAWFEFKRLIRSPGMLLYTVVMPVASYAVFTIGSSGTVGGMPVDTSIMLGLAGYGALTGVLTLSAGVSSERTYGWLRQLRVTPLQSWQVVLVKIFICTPIAIPSVLAVGLAGYVEHGVRLSTGHWALVLIALWLGTIPFSLLGLAMGYALKPNFAQSASFLAFFTLSALGGLFVPDALFPAPMRALAHALPSNRYLELGKSAAIGHAPTVTGAAILLAWTLVFCLLAAAAYRRSARTR
ncbi:MAG TPA: ABC transporter permease [Micromonosporaceae bacterium]|jgi:ABC-2 type transport system permease protein